MSLLNENGNWARFFSVIIENSRYSGQFVFRQHSVCWEHRTYHWAYHNNILFQSSTNKPREPTHTRLKRLFSRNAPTSTVLLCYCTVQNKRKYSSRLDFQSTGIFPSSHSTVTHQCEIWFVPSSVCMSDNENNFLGNEMRSIKWNRRQIDFKCNEIGKSLFQLAKIEYWLEVQR